MGTVRDQLFETLRHLEMTTIFANPGSTEVALLTDLPDDLDFVLALHENSVVAMAAGHALAADRPSLVLLHTTAGFGNAVGAIATARTNHAPLVILVGQQDRRHIASEPFLAGHLDGLAGDYPVSIRTPACAQAIPGAVQRAYHEAVLGRGPAVVIVPMGDWDEPAEEQARPAAPTVVRRSQAADPVLGAELSARLDAARHPAIVVGPEADSPEAWRAIAALADRLDAPVWQESSASQAGFAHDHPRFRGHLPPLRPGLRKALADHDLVLVVGGPAFRQGTYRPGPFVEPGTDVVVVTQLEDVATYSAADLVVLGDVVAVVADLAERVAPRADATAFEPRDLTHLVPATDGPLRAEHVYAAVAARLPAESTVLEESPSTRSKLLELMPARAPFGFLTIAQGGLGFAIPASTGVKMARPDRPVVAMVGDGASLYGIQALWSAAHYRVGTLYVILNNGGYAVMDRLAADHGGKPPWPGFGEIDPGLLAQGFGCASIRVESHEQLLAVLDEVVPTLGERREPLLLDVRVES
ncbi:thiamine pyrophosphate-dependent enzyme [Nocardioides sp. cx-169]|uniref:thiamine pyrophosphate-dependent enzyme n=1 Tax=Nocardioides sp. cx-169 TaxID=2899080 RepID=UPI001E2BC175|nr:thiamine pyrophosphate-dependent enzyme [Nocardioides sp. cx-169]MCD4534307.1 thiamine pyrophosphate-dependent enzyme [Nocardioides sp. cx-169]